ncbi:MAG: HNH endonuclease [Oscillospiraceae bacterium]|nr:HNH endonuclease [Oscillospiraceae bacterium]
MKGQERERRNEWVRQQRISGRSMKDIAIDLGISENGVLYICAKVGCRGVMADPEETARRQRAASRATGDKLMKTPEQINLELRPFGFEYVSGYAGCDSKVRIRCLKCGAEIERYYNFTRKELRHYCPECQRIEGERRKARQQQERVNRQELQRQAKSEQLELRIAVCKQCGRPFVQTRGGQAFCSERCRKTALNRRKDRRLTAANTVDKDITLERLYKRDSGVCYICGKVCDWNDFIVEDGVTICGDNYPSIEHVTPISKGGLHSWDNVRLACRRCNTLKRNNPLPFFYSN